MAKRTIILLGAAVLMSAGALSSAHADGDRWHGGWHEHWRHEHHGWGPRYYPPPRVYYAPPPPVYYAPPPVYYAPPPVYAAPGLSVGVNIPLR